jgi:hypothetical protein
LCGYGNKLYDIANGIWYIIADAVAGANICTIAGFADIHASWLASAAKNE